MNKKIENALAYAKEHKKEIIIGGGLILVGAVAGAAVTHNMEFGKVAGRYKSVIGFDNKDHRDFIDKFFAGDKRLLSMASNNDIDKNGLIDDIPEVCDNLPKDGHFEVLIMKVLD